MFPRPRVLTLLFIISLGHVLLISAQVQSTAGRSVLHTAGFEVLAHIQEAAGVVGRSTGGLWSRYVALVGASRENEALRLRVLELEAEVQQQRARAAEASALEGLLGLRDRMALDTVAARVVAASPSPERLHVLIDRGRRDGVGPDMAVFGTGGVIGRVVGQPAARAAQVELLIAHDAGAGAVLEDSGAGGIVMGASGEAPLRLEFVPDTVPVAIGERVLTSGQDGIYPPGLVIGTVVDVRAGDLMREVDVRPAVDFSHLDHVLVVLTPPVVPENEEP